MKTCPQRPGPWPSRLRKEADYDKQRLGTPRIAS